MPYFTLLQRDNESAPWGIEFGDHMKATVETEAEFYRGQGYRRADQRIIKTRTSRQSEIDSAVAKLNASELLPEDKQKTKLAPIADRLAAAIYRQPLNPNRPMESVIRDAADLHTGGELECFALDMLCDMIAKRLQAMTHPAETASQREMEHESRVAAFMNPLGSEPGKHGNDPAPAERKTVHSNEGCAVNPYDGVTIRANDSTENVMLTMREDKKVCAVDLSPEAAERFAVKLIEGAKLARIARQK